jgi:hypothetical protein
MRWVPRVLAALSALFVLPLDGCDRPAPRPAARDLGRDLAVTVLADTAETGGLPPARLAGPAPSARLTLVRIAPARPGLQNALPEPEPSAPPAGERAGDGLAADDELRPPIPRGPATVRLHAPRSGWLELDVRVDEAGEVSDALPAGGDADSSTVRAAVDAALALRWFPATRRGRPVAVWCRQRFEVGPAR